MELARAVLQCTIGGKAEAYVFQTHSTDLDAYIEAACSRPCGGMRCPRCTEKSACIEMLQTRSADEGMTPFLVCTLCSYRSTFK